MKSSPLASLLYVSTSSLESEAEHRELEAIVQCALSRNADLEVTGALVFTGTNFAQSLEGPQDSLDRLMAGIVRDPRHRDVRMIPVQQCSGRRFDGWSLAYAGPSLFVAGEVGRLLNESGQPASASRLLRLMQGLATDDLATG